MPGPLRPDAGRALNFYGDPKPWEAQASLLASLLSFVNAEKYPPSLVYLTMTLGPALALLYPLARWFAALKQRRAEWWLSYL